MFFSVWGLIFSRVTRSSCSDFISWNDTETKATFVEGITASFYTFYIYFESDWNVFTTTLDWPLCHLMLILLIASFGNTGKVKIWLGNIWFIPWHERKCLLFFLAIYEHFQENQFDGIGQVTTGTRQNVREQFSWLVLRPWLQSPRGMIGLRTLGTSMPHRALCRQCLPWKPSSFP